MQANCEFKDDLDLPSVIIPIALAVFEIILRLGGIIAVIFVIVGGFQFITSQGEPDRIKNARGTIINALIGLVITISATVIVNLVSGVLL